jgi:type IV secretory pathway VirB9-like protein
MKLRWFIPIALLIPLRLSATDAAVGARVATITINPREITVLHLRPEFESTIRMPEEVTSVILGSPGEFKAEHNEGEPEYVYVKPITKQAAQSNLLIATKSGQHVTLELVSEYAITSSARRGWSRERAPTAWSSSTGPISKSPPNNFFSR